MAFPLKFKEFVKDPVKGVLFLALIAIMYLYIDNKMVYVNVIEKLEIRTEKLEGQVMELQDKLLEVVTEGQ
jgi:hypothetical protein